jgi:hypothetical protein
VSVPRISGFARLANGNVAPDRIIEGQTTNLSRTMHGLAYDDLHDEIVVPVALSGAVLVFRGGAAGDEAPLRVIQGSKTGMIRPQTVEVDPVNNEIVAADSSSRAILVYDRTANGDVEPKRRIGGDKTLFRDIIGIAVDAKSNLILASTRSTDGFSGILMFDRMANEASLKRLREVEEGERAENRSKRDPFTSAGFIGAWRLTDDGDIPPRLIIRGPDVGATGYAGVAFSAKHGELYGVSGGLNGYTAWIIPEFFKRPRQTDNAPR